jgi:hypothetical protein
MRVGDRVTRQVPTRLWAVGVVGTVVETYRKRFNKMINVQLPDGKISIGNNQKNLVLAEQSWVHIRQMGYKL